MKSLNQSLTYLALTLAVTLSHSLANASNHSSSHNQTTNKLLTANFELRNVVKIEAGDFHFAPGQIAPIHTHAAPAVGYVVKGTIIYQVEGEKPQILKEGDAFFEPAGPRILRFDNASATEEAVFIDFNLQQENEPFIIFEKELTEKIDRRSLPTTQLNNKKISRVDMFISELPPQGRKSFDKHKSILAYVGEGIVYLEEIGKPKKRVVAGSTFTLSLDSNQAVVSNASNEVDAKVIAFYLR